MNLQDFIKLLRTRWITVCATIVACVLASVVVTMLTTPLYKASTRLFVSTSAGSTLAETYQGNRFSQERVLSYRELIQGETLAQRTIDKLGLDMTSEELRNNVQTGAKPDTVLINVSVTDESPVRARDIANTLSDEFATMVRELETPEPGARPDARVIVEQRASVPQRPVVPRTKRNLAVGLGLGILVGIGLAALRDTLDNSVKDGDTVERITGTGLVGHIPLDKERRTRPAISFDNETSAIAEAFRKLRTNLQFLAVDNPPRVIVVTSSLSGEGKSTTAINIALALAEAEHKVVIVDGDMRRPTLHKYLNLVGSVGLSTVLSGQAFLDDALQETRFSGLTALTSGAIPPNPSELLGSQSAKKLLADLRARFNYVIVDSTPLLAVTDAAILAAGADGALIMARFGQTKKDQLAHAVGSLESVGASLLGAVLTLVPTRRAGSYGYGYKYENYAPDAQEVGEASTVRSKPADYSTADSARHSPKD